ncbi:unnamed protein product, partial [Adineta steineri]
MPRKNQAKDDLIEFARQYYRGNRKEEKNITEFEKSYDVDESIYWYTKDSFLYKLVNKALRTEDIGQLHLFRFFISDLSLKLANIHKSQIRKQENTVKLYRGLKMGNDELKKLKENLGCIISANGFLSTSYSKDIAMGFATKPTKRTDIVSVLQEIECSSNTLESIVFANITKSSEFEAEQEVLFDLGSTFKIESISENDPQFFVVKLTATDAGSRIKDSTRPMTIMAHVYLRKEMYEESLDFYLDVLVISEKFYGRKHLDTAVALDHIGNAYLEIRDYEQALVYYEKSFKIRQEQLPRVHLDIAASLNNLGLVRWGLQSIDEALEHLQESLKIRKQLLPSNHISIIQ